MGKINHNFDYNDLETRNETLDILKFRCPHCTNEEGEFADMVLFVPKGGYLATQCACNGQHEKCGILAILMQSYNCEKMLYGEEEY